MVKVNIKKLNNESVIPKYSHEGDAGFDLCSVDNYILKPGESLIVKTGLSMEIPEGYVGLVWDRSGMAAKHSIHTLAGVIDSGYRGEVGVVMTNLGSEKFKIDKKDRIAQMLIQPVQKVEFYEVENVSNTSRNDCGFGSTGRCHQI